jgi:arylsulfatase
MSSDRPSFVIFMLDQLSAKWLEQDGVVETPNIDRLRRRGVTFDRACSSNPVCMPARASLATGLASRGHGVLQNGYVLDSGIPTFASILRNEGWHTAAIGKLHHVPHTMDIRPDYRPYGYDRVHLTEDDRGGEWLDWIEREHPDHYEAALSTVWARDLPGFTRYGERGVDLSERITRARKRFPEVARGFYALPFPQELSQTEWITGRALDFILERDPEDSFCVQISYVQPHTPFSPPGDYLDRVAVDRLPEPLPPTWLDDPHAPRFFAHYREREALRQNREQWREIRHHYFADLVHLDEQLGRVLDALETSRRAEHTYVLLLADHGEMLLDHGLSAKGEMHYDACIRVPMVVSGPGLDRGVTRQEFVHLEDVFPTVLELAGVEQPQLPALNPQIGMPIGVAHGRSVVALARGRDTDWRREAYCESYNIYHFATPQQWARTVRDERFRFTWYPNGGGEQLFDLERDPDETVNRAADADYATVRNDLRDRLLECIVMQDYPHVPRGLYSLGVH